MTILSRRVRRKATPYLLALPACALVAVFLYGVIGGLMQGFGIMPFIGRTDFTLDYYVTAFTRPDLAGSIVYSTYIALVSSVIALTLGVLLAFLLTKARTSRMVRLFNIQIPIMTMHAVVALAVICIFSGSGLFPRILNVFGIVDSPTSFPSVVGAPSGWGIIAVYAWKEIPFVAFSTVTIMANISGSYDEAASTLGASPLRTFFGVTLPLCRGAAIKAFMIVFVFALGSYEIPFLLGPTMPKTLPVLAYIEFQDPDIVNRCYAMALNGIMAMICAIAAAVYFIVLYRERKMQRR